MKSVEATKTTKSETSKAKVKGKSNFRQFLAAKRKEMNQDCDSEKVEAGTPAMEMMSSEKIDSRKERDEIVPSSVASTEASVTSADKPVTNDRVDNHAEIENYANDQYDSGVSSEEHENLKNDDDSPLATPLEGEAFPYDSAPNIVIEPLADDSDHKDQKEEQVLEEENSAETRG